MAALRSLSATGLVLLVLWLCVGLSRTASAADELLQRIEETPPAPSALQRLDGVFAKAVGALERVLFYRLGQSERYYILYEPESLFYRPAGSAGPYRKFDLSDDYPRPELDETDLNLLAARGSLAAGHGGELFRRGVVTLEFASEEDARVTGGRATKVDTEYGVRYRVRQPVEYIIVKRDDRSDETVHYGDKFILAGSPAEPGNYRKLAAARGLMTDVTVDAATMDAWDLAGDLKRPDAPLADAPPYLHREWVGGIPVVVAWLSLGAVIFTLYMGFFNIWGFRHALAVVRGKYDNPTEAGEVTHSQALASALSATVGLGNIAGVTLAMTAGGPGAFFWMLMCGILGMSTKFVECTLAVKYRTINPDGTVLGGPMKYLRHGLQERRLGGLGGLLAFAFSIMCLLASFGGGNMFQANQAGAAMLHAFQKDRLDELAEVNLNIKAAAVANDVQQLTELQTRRADLEKVTGEFGEWFRPVFGLILAGLVAIVIVGGIKRIGAAAEKIVPAMCLIYIAACLYIICMHLDRVPEMVAMMFTEAFSPRAVGGGLLGVLVIGVQRASFSNEAGAGSAPIAHSTAKTSEPVREGCVALLEPFIDTVIVCSMTALVILLTGAWNNDEWILDQGLRGSALTSKAFGAELPWFPYVLSVAVTLFAYSTIISWSYYGERAWESLFGRRTTILYKLLAIAAVFVGTVVNLGSVLDFSDMMILGMAFPNILGLLLLAPMVKKDLAAYWAKYKAGEFPVYR